MRVFAYHGNQKILRKSSSGGAFLGIAEAFLKINVNGLVYGAAFDDDLVVRHMCVDNINGCLKFCGSKYVKSNMQGIILEVANKLVEGHNILFTGTPCQIYSLVHYLKKSNISASKLLTVDIICHGTPDVVYWEDYKEWLNKKYKSKLVDFRFRYKGEVEESTNRLKYSVCACFENGLCLKDTFESRLFTNLFFTQLPLNSACYKCKFSSLTRYSDITIGDFWGYQTVMNKKLPNGTDGMSLMLFNTLKGENVLNEIIKMVSCDKEGYIEECLSDRYIEFQHNLNKPTDRPELKSRFDDDYKKYGFNQILVKYAGYNFRGRVKHFIKRCLAFVGYKVTVSDLYK